MTFDGYKLSTCSGTFWFPNMYNQQNTYHLMLLWLARNFAGDCEFKWLSVPQIDADYLVDLNHISDINPLNPPKKYDLSTPTMSSGSEQSHVKTS